jgi:hypothetical protein
MHGKAEHIPAIAEVLEFDDWSQLFSQLLSLVEWDCIRTGRSFEREDRADKEQLSLRLV